MGALVERLTEGPTLARRVFKQATAHLRKDVADDSTMDKWSSAISRYCRDNNIDADTKKEALLLNKKHWQYPTE